MFRPFSSGNRYLHQRKIKVSLDKFDGSPKFLRDSTFLIVRGLAGKGISFQSTVDATRYIQHKNYNLYISVNDNTAVFKQDATFNVRYGLGATAGRFGISFESINKPGYFISAHGIRPHISRRRNTVVFMNAATWMPVTANVNVNHRTTTHIKKPIHTKGESKQKYPTQNSKWINEHY